MSSKVICSWPYLVLVFAGANWALVTTASGFFIRVQAPFMSIQVVWSTKTLSARTAWHFTFKGLVMPLLVFPMASFSASPHNELVKRHDLLVFRLSLQHLVADIADLATLITNLVVGSG